MRSRRGIRARGAVAALRAMLMDERPPAQLRLGRVGRTPAAMHAVPLTDRYLAADLIGFAAGLVITVLLLALTIRARRIPGTPFANILLVACALAWNAGGLGRVIAQATGVPKDTGAALVGAAVQFSGAAVWPVPLLAIWRPFAVRRWQRWIAHALLAISIVDAAVIVSALWVHAL